MADRQLNKESARPIVAGGHTFEKVPWNGKYDPTGETDWIKGVREDLTREDVLSDRIRKKIREWQLEIYEEAFTRARKAGLLEYVPPEGLWTDKTNSLRDLFEKAPARTFRTVYATLRHRALSHKG